MTIKFCQHLMISDVTTDTAIRRLNGWEVSWLPDRRLGRDQAITAMVLAEALVYASDPQEWIRDHISNWMAELGVIEDELPSATRRKPPAQGGDR